MRTEKRFGTSGLLLGGCEGGKLKDAIRQIERVRQSRSPRLRKIWTVSKFQGPVFVVVANAICWSRVPILPRGANYKGWRQKKSKGICAKNEWKVKAEVKANNKWMTICRGRCCQIPPFEYNNNKGPKNASSGLPSSPSSFSSGIT